MKIPLVKKKFMKFFEAKGNRIVDRISSNCEWELLSLLLEHRAMSKQGRAPWSAQRALGQACTKDDLPPSGPGLQVAPDLVMWSWHWRASLAALGKAGNRILEQGLQLSAHSPELTRALCRWGVPQLVWLWGAVGKGCTVCKAFPFTGIYGQTECAETLLVFLQPSENSAS